MLINTIRNFRNPRQAQTPLSFLLQSLALGGHFEVLCTFGDCPGIE